MRLFPTSRPAFVGLLALAVLGPPARAQSYPTDVLMEWEYENNMAWLAYNRGDYNAAELRFNEAIKTLKPHPASPPRLLARTYQDLARTLHAQKRYDAADPLQVWVLEIRRRDARTKPETLFECLYLLAIIRRDRGMLDDAEHHLLEALAIEEKYAAPDDDQLALTLKDMGELKYRLKKFQDADAFTKRSIAILRKYSPDYNLDLADALERHARTLDALKQVDESKSAVDEVQRIRENVRRELNRRDEANSRRSFDHSRLRPATP